MFLKNLATSNQIKIVKTLRLEHIYGLQLDNGYLYTLNVFKNKIDRFNLAQSYSRETLYSLKHAWSKSIITNNNLVI